MLCRTFGAQFYCIHLSRRSEAVSRLIRWRFLHIALKGPGSKAQGEGRQRRSRAAAETLGRNEVHEEPCKGETEACSALAGLILFLILLPRVSEPAARALPPWAALHRACSAQHGRITQFLRSPCDGASFIEIRNFHCSYTNKVVGLDLDLVLDLDRLFDRALLDNRRLVQVQVEGQVQHQVAPYRDTLDCLTSPRKFPGRAFPMVTVYRGFAKSAHPWLLSNSGAEYFQLRNRGSKLPHTGNCRMDLSIFMKCIRKGGNLNVRL
jgi:hypothetical protein